MGPQRARGALLGAVLLLVACSSGDASRFSTSAPPLITPTPQPTASPSPTQTATPGLLPLVDAHLHYSRESWTAYPPEKIKALLDTVGVRSALVSSAPDDGTARLQAALGDRVVPMLGPYRAGGDVFSWTRDGSVVAYVRSASDATPHRGFGEFHLLRGQISLPVVKGVLAIAAEKKLFLQPHADAAALAELLATVGPDATVLWAHAGVTATPAQIDGLLAQWPKLSIELSLRDDVAPQGTLDPQWRALLLKYRDRFLVGTDTWTVGGTYTGNERWDAYAQIVAGIRAWLDQLPQDTREAIAFRNADRFLAQSLR